MTDTRCKIENDVLYTCLTPPVRGAKDRVLIIPKRGISGYDLDTTNPLIIEAINRYLNAGETAYEVRAFEYVGEGKILSPNNQLVEDDFGVRFLHELEFHVSGVTPAKKWELTKLSRETEGVVVILIQNYKDPDGKSKYLVLGRDVGLFVKEMADEEGRNIYRVLLGSKDDFEEPFPPSNLFDTDETATDALVAALLSTDLP